MKHVNSKYYLITDGGFAGYFGLNNKRTKIHKGFNEIFKLYISHSNLIKDILISIDDIRYMEYESPTDKIFKKFTK